jgi:excisionase family DNA binding protein
MQKSTLTPREVASLIGAGRTKTYELLRAGQIRSLRVGKQFAVPREAVEAFLAGRDQRAISPAILEEINEAGFDPPPSYMCPDCLREAIAHEAEQQGRDPQDLMLAILCFWLWLKENEED